MTAIAPIKFVAIGGGTGLSTLLKGLKPYLVSPDSAKPANAAKAAKAAKAANLANGANVAIGAIGNRQTDTREEGAGSAGKTKTYPQVSLTAIVTVTDDGKSSGRLRGEFSVLPPGDIRNCLVALADEDQFMTRLFRHRYPGDGAIGGHSLGNLILLALGQMNGSFLTGIEQARGLLGITARVLPSTLERVDLVAQVGNRMVRGQVAIKSQNAPIRELTISPPDACALPEAVQAILDADLITLGPGSLFSSIIANLLVRDIAKALVESKAKKIYICNAMTEFDETDGLTAVDHIKQLLAYLPGLKLDYALFNSAPISAEMLDRYASERAVALKAPSSAELAELADSTFKSRAVEFISLPLISESRAVRHAPEKLIKAIFNIYAR